MFPFHQGCYDEATQTCDWHHDCGERDLTKCNAVTNADLHSSVMALQMRETIGQVTGQVPHLVVSRLHRSKLDPNRFKDDAAQYDPVAEKAYQTFHGIIGRVHNLMGGGPAVHFDIHGYLTHNTDNWTEIGYNIRREALNEDVFTPEESSIRALAGRVVTGDLTWDSLVRGPHSLGALFQQEAFRTVPSPQYPQPQDGTEGKYFRGGYITRRWGSLTKGSIDAVQIEFPQWIRDNVPLYGPKLGRAMAAWIQKYYG